MKRSENDVKRKLKLRSERLRQLDTGELEQVAGGWYRTCMSTWATAYSCNP